MGVPRRAPSTAAELILPRPTLPKLREAARTCTACDLHERGTQTVFGAGPKGDAKPNSQEIRACKPWLEAEIALVQPDVIVLLGATAAQALLGSGFRVSRQRGQALCLPQARAVIATVHPSSILRAPDDEARRRERALFVRDLRAVAQALDREGALARSQPLGSRSGR